MKYRTGDIVRCTDNDGAAELKKRRLYMVKDPTLLSWGMPAHYIFLGPNYGYFSSNRFKLVDRVSEVTKLQRTLLE